ncbi:MAG: hypothetical protein QOI13_710 [Paraburkholderia sp.]|jgi:hypothetical protein|nr:hypothetical protein [Paraburkholderia sp.]MEA3122228.1 hypothetical protein [Paraburkholderia sp.]
MNKKLVGGLIGLAVLAVSTAASAHVDLAVGIGFPAPMVYSAPTPVYVAPQPVYVAPQPVYAPAPPAYVGGPPVYVGGPPQVAVGYWDRDNWREREWRRREWREHAWREHDRGDRRGW